MQLHDKAAQMYHGRNVVFKLNIPYQHPYCENKSLFNT